MLMNWYKKELICRFSYCVGVFVLCAAVCFVYRESLLFIFLKPYRDFFGDESLLILGVKELLYWELVLSFFVSVCAFHLLFLVTFIHFLSPSLFISELRVVFFVLFVYCVAFVGYCYFSFYVIAWLISCWYSFGYVGLYGESMRFSLSLSLETYGSFFIEFFLALWLLGCFLIIFAFLFSRVTSVVGYFRFRVFFYLIVLVVIAFVLPADISLHFVVGSILAVFFEMVLFLFIFLTKSGEVA